MHLYSIIYYTKFNELSPPPPQKKKKKKKFDNSVKIRAEFGQISGIIQTF